MKLGEILIIKGMIIMLLMKKILKKIKNRVGMLVMNRKMGKKKKMILK
jgi:hypothetical protein